MRCAILFHHVLNGLCWRGRNDQAWRQATAHPSGVCMRCVATRLLDRLYMYSVRGVFPATTIPRVLHAVRWLWCLTLWARFVQAILSLFAPPTGLVPARWWRWLSHLTPLRA